MTWFERADTGRTAKWYSVLGLILVPIVIAAGFVFAIWKATDRLDNVQAAIVNLDEGAEIDGQTVPLGRQLAAGLVDSDDENFDWVLSDEEDSDDGLRNGTYAAVITIPKGFSEAVTSSSDDDPMMARQATISVKTSHVTPLADSAIGQSIAEAARASFNSEFAKKYLDGIYLGFNDISKQFKTVSDAANEINDGAGQLADGTGDAADGAGKLSDGLGELSANSGQLRSGAGDLASGARDLSTGAGDLSDGAGELADGLGTMREQTKDLPEQTRKLADGAGDLSDGVDEYTRGVDDMIIGLSDFADGLGDGKDLDFGDKLDGLGEGAQDLNDGINRINDGVGDYQDKLKQQSDDLKKLQQEDTLTLEDLVKAGLMDKSEAAQLKQVLCPDGDDEQCRRTQDAYARGVLKAAQSALDQAVEGLDQKDENGRSIKDGLQDLTDGANELNDGIQDMVKNLGDKLPKLLDDLKGLGGKADKLLDASKELRNGAGQVADGTDKLADGMGPLADGVKQSADGAGKLSDGASQLSDGAGTLADGADEYSAGVNKYTEGVDQSATGASTLSDGLTDLDDGAEQLADGTGELAEGLDEGKDKIPSYTAPERDKLSNTVVAPVAESGSLLNDIPQASSIALLLMMALWVGALVTYTVVRAVSATALTSRRSSFSVMAKGMLPGLVIAVIQAVVLAIIANIVLELNLFDFASVLLLVLFAGLVFMTLNYALVAWFGGTGRFISVVLIVLAVAGRAIGAVPEFFHTITPFLPMTPAMDGITAAATGMPGLGGAWAALFGWLVIGVAGSFAAVVRKRTLGAGQVARLAHI